VLLYVALCGFVFFSQRDLIFFPSREIRSFPRDTNLKEVAIKTQDGINLNAWFVDNKSDKTIIFFHGNGGNIYSNQERITLFQSLGVNALMFDYRGYGKSEGQIHRENDVYLDGEAAYEYILSRGTKPQNIIIWGQSLGNVAAIHVSQWRPLYGTIIESAFVSMDRMASAQYWFIPTHLLLQFHFANIDKVPNILSPTLVIHSREDEMIGIQNGRELFEKLKTPKEFIETHGSHNGGLSQSFVLYKEVLEKFLKR
jgi:fermentation-respiration switch protein FrsA (DUF1100 family)